MSNFRQGILPIIRQLATEKIIEENMRLLDCWLGISIGEQLGTKFCTDCEFLGDCIKLYRLLAGPRKLHPSAVTRKVYKLYSIRSEYIESMRIEDIDCDDFTT